MRKVLPLAALCLVSLAAATARTAVTRTVVSEVPEPTIVTAKEWGSTPEPFPDDYKSVPRIITIHHAGELWKPGDDPMKKIKALQSWGQKEKKHWRDVPYHFMIAPDGRVFEGRSLEYKPDTNTKYELSGVLNIELWGNFEEQRVSPQQLKALVLLIAKLAKERNLDLSLIRGHGDAAVGQTVCPGKDFKRYIDQGLIRKWSEEAVAGKMPEITELPELPGGPTTQISTDIATDIATHVAPSTQPGK